MAPIAKSVPGAGSIAAMPRSDFSLSLTDGVFAALTGKTPAVIATNANTAVGIT
jgi:hypothetical protein